MNLARLHGSARMASRWLREHLADNGQWQFGLEPCIDIYYKAPWCFAANGDPVAAGATLAHIEQNYLRSDGDLCPSGNPVNDERHAFYQHAFVAIGARLGGRPDMAARMLDFLAAQQHPDLGAWGSRADVPSRRCDTISTAAVGLAFVESHRLDEAEKAARFLHYVIEQQPDPGASFFFSTNPEGRLLTPAAEEHEAAERHVRFTARGQLWWALGFPLVFLARLYEESGDPVYMDTCLRYLGLIERCPQAWNDASSGKLAAGCAVLYRVTGEQRHRNNALRAATALVARQNAVGAWYRVRKGPPPHTFRPSAVGLEISTEFAHWLALVSQTLGEADRVRGLPTFPTTDESPVARWLRQAERVLLQRKLTVGQRWLGWKAGLRRRMLRGSART